MPKAKLHWTYDLFAVALVGGISGLVFWLLPPAEPAKPLASIDTLTSALCRHQWSTPTCNVVNS